MKRMPMISLMISLTLFLLLALTAGLEYHFSHHSHLVKLEWETVPLAVSYHVYRSEGAATPKIIATVPGLEVTGNPKLTYTDYDVYGGHIYFYELKSVNALGVESVATRTVARIPLHYGEKFVPTIPTVPSPPHTSAGPAQAGPA